MTNSSNRSEFVNYLITCKASLLNKAPENFKSCEQ